MKTNKEYIEVISEFIRATESGRLVWKKQNPTTIYLESTTTGGEKAIISIQKVQERRITRDERGRRSPETVEFHLFTVKNSSNRELVVQIDSKVNEEVGPYISNLYEIANYNIEKRNIDFLKDIMRNI